MENDTKLTELSVNADLLDRFFPFLSFFTLLYCSEIKKVYFCNLNTIKTYENEKVLFYPFIM